MGRHEHERRGVLSTADPDYTFVGPGLNAWNMRSRGWLDENRVWKPLSRISEPKTSFSDPSHRRDLRGYLAAELGPYLIEFRSAERWDAGLQGGSGILIHRFNTWDNRSYVMGSPAAVALTSPFGAHPQKVGETFQVGDESKIFDTVYRCEVISIDDGAPAATIRLSYRPAPERPGPHQRPFEFGIIGSDAGGIYLQGGVLHRIPPYGPILQIMQQINAYSDTASLRDTGLRSVAQATALIGIIRQASEALHALDPIRSPAPTLTYSTVQAQGALTDPTNSDIGEGTEGGSS